MTIEQLTLKIKELKSGRTLKVLKQEDVKTYYKVTGLSSKLSTLKAAENGQFVTVEDLKEFKNLIIWLFNRKIMTGYNSKENLQSAMSELLKKVNNNELIYKTKRSIKNIICDAFLSCVGNVVFDCLKAEFGNEFTNGSYGWSKSKTNYDNWKLDVLLSK